LFHDRSSFPFPGVNVKVGASGAGSAGVVKDFTVQFEYEYELLEPVVMAPVVAFADDVREFVVHTRA
jgi:hypothetical protein